MVCSLSREAGDGLNFTGFGSTTLLMLSSVVVRYVVLFVVIIISFLQCQGMQSIVSYYTLCHNNFKNIFFLNLMRKVKVILKFTFSSFYTIFGSKLNKNFATVIKERFGPKSGS